MEPYIVLADKQVNGHRRGLAFSALPDAPVLAPTTPGVLRRQVTRIARWTRLRPEARDRAGRLFDAVENVLPVANLPGTHPALELVQCLGKALRVVKAEKALHARPLDEEMALHPWSLG